MIMAIIVTVIANRPVKSQPVPSGPPENDDGWQITAAG